ncbi:putative mitochondrial protein, partial [Mucuna pruriens]
MTLESSFVEPSISKFNGYYDHWTVLMENFLHSKEYWDLVENGIREVTEGIPLTDVQRKSIDDQKLKDLKAKNVGSFYFQFFYSYVSSVSFQHFKSSMKHEFDMIDLSKMRYFLGLEVLQRSDGIFLCQKKYALEMLQRFGMDRINSVHNPIVPGVKLTKDESGVKVDKTYYKQIVESLMYLTSTRPDMMSVVNLISRYMENPTELHLLVVKRVLRYLKGTTDFGIFYKKEGNKELLAYTDSDYARDLDDRKSTSGYVFLLCSVVVSWSSRKQPIVSLSTIEVELIGTASCACQAI